MHTGVTARAPGRRARTATVAPPPCTDSDTRRPVFPFSVSDLLGQSPVVPCQGRAKPPFSRFIPLGRNGCPGTSPNFRSCHDARGDGVDLSAGLRSHVVRTQLAVSHAHHPTTSQRRHVPVRVVHGIDTYGDACEKHVHNANVPMMRSVRWSGEHQRLPVWLSRHRTLSHGGNTGRKRGRHAPPHPRAGARSLFSGAGPSSARAMVALGSSTSRLLPSLATPRAAS